ncbi:MAG: ChbG/HpnK family deacetylase [Candidatus Komeilibacteria bacterium]|nr:ChbG/HpnK family deacetylase [Candidatus Komeilibacteria bacterium]
MIKLIVTADDFGYSKLYNKMILELIEEQAVTSTSVMIDEIDNGQKDQVERLIQLSKKNLVSVGLHIYFKNINFEVEIDRQFEKFVAVFGFEPSHLDIHKKDYLKEGFPLIQEFCKKKNIPCKNLSLFDDKLMNIDGLITTKDSIFDGTRKTFSQISEWLGSLRGGSYCINFHPGYYDPNSVSSLNKEREADAENIRKMVRGLSEYNIELANFNDLAKEYQK